MKAFLRFSSGRPRVSAQERKILSKLGEAAKIISSLYLAQKNPRYRGANFYPSDATKQEIEVAAEKDPEILSPYTFVERKGEKLVAVPYRVKFKKELSEIAKLLKEAAVLSSDTHFQAYLKARAEDLLKDNYDRSNILWLKTEHSKLSCVIGAFDRYIDKLFFKKRAYMAWTGILDEETTNEMHRFKELILTSERGYLPGAKRAKISRVNIRVEDSIIFSGLIADFLFVGNNLPSSDDISLIEKYGTTFTLFKQTHEWRFESWILPIFQQVFTRDVQRKFSVEELKKAFFKTSILHESCHSLMSYEDAPARLGEFLPYFGELFADLLGIKGCGTLILKNVLTERELEVMVLITICHSLYFYASLSVRPHLNPYAVGGGLILEFLRKGQALTKHSGGFRLDSYRALIALNQLTSIIEYYVALGNHKEAEEFLKKFSIERMFTPFDPYLKGIPRKSAL